MKFTITCKFGVLSPSHPKPHTGIDFAAPHGEPLRSIRNGVIEKVVDYGNVNIGKGVFVKWEDGKTAIYGHLSKVADSISKGDIVHEGDLLGYVGSTGHSTGNHLHFGLKDEFGRIIDPSPYISDIQHMNDKVNHFVEKVDIINKVDIIQQTYSFSDLFQSQMEILKSSMEYFNLITFNHIIETITSILNTLFF